MAHRTVSRRRVVAGSLAGAAAASLPGCAAVEFISAEPPTLYTLTPKSTFDENLPTVEWQLLIEPPVAATALDTVRISLLSTPFQIDYFADVAWSERAPAMVQTLLVESFENSGRIVSVGRETFGLRADYVLKTELREFQAELYRNERPPPVRVRLNCKLVRMPERVIIAGANFEDMVTPVANTAEGVIQAFDESLGDVMRDVVEWSLVTGQADWRTRQSV